MRRREEDKEERRVRIRGRQGGRAGRTRSEEEEKKERRIAEPSVTFFPVCFSTMSLLRENSSCCGVLEHPPLGIVLLPSLDLHLYGHRFVINSLLQKRRRGLKFVELKTETISNSCDRVNLKNVTSSSDQCPGRGHLVCTQVVNTSRKNIYTTLWRTQWGQAGIAQLQKPEKVTAMLLGGGGQYLSLSLIACGVPAALALLFGVEHHTCSLSPTPPCHSFPHGHGHTQDAVLASQVLQILSATLWAIA